jgi:hypothetical protein
MNVNPGPLSDDSPIYFDLVNPYLTQSPAEYFFSLFLLFLLFLTPYRDELWRLISGTSRGWDTPADINPFLIARECNKGSS